MEKKLSILVILPFLPFPPDDGGKIASYTFLENLRDRHDFTLLVPVHDADQARLVIDQQKKWPDVRIVSAEYGFSSIFEKFVYIMRKIISRAKGFIRSRSYVFGNKDFLYPFLSSEAAFFNKLKLLLAENKYDVVQCEYVQNLALVDFLPKDTKKIYVEVESRYSLINDYVLLEPLAPRGYYTHIAENVKTVESAFLSKYDALVAYSRDDQERLQKLLPGKVVYKSPLNLITEPVVDISFENFSVEKLVFVGHEAHTPNRDAVVWFIEEIYPHLSAFDKKFYILGRWSARFIKRYSKVPGVVFTGFVDDIEDFIRNSINVAPIRLGGGGIRMKVLLSISNGIPVVGTSKACHGFDFVHGQNSMIAETSADFVTSISELLADSEKALALAENAYQLYLENYSVALTTEIRNKIYNELACA